MATGDYVDLSEIQGMIELNNYRFKVEKIDADSFSLKDINDNSDIDTSGYSAYTEGGYARYAALSVSGLRALDGEAVSIFADGAVIGTKTVTQGVVTLDNRAGIVHVGLPYTCDLELLDFERTGGETLQDKKRGIVSVYFGVEDSREFSVGPNENKLEDVVFRVVSDGYDAPTPLFSGEREKSMRSNLVREGGMLIRVSDPVPVTIASIIARIKHGER
jgi:hypothetical protein